MNINNVLINCVAALAFLFLPSVTKAQSPKDSSLSATNKAPETPRAKCGKVECFIPKPVVVSFTLRRLGDNPETLLQIDKGNFAQGAFSFKREHSYIASRFEKDGVNMIVPGVFSDGVTASVENHKNAPLLFKLDIEKVDQRPKHVNDLSILSSTRAVVAFPLTEGTSVKTFKINNVVYDVEVTYTSSK